MVQRALRLLIIVAAIGVLLMHGADASAAATHETAPAVAHEHRGEDGATDGHSVHWHHVALACIAVLTAAVAVARRGRPSKIDCLVRPAPGVAASWHRPVPMLLAAGPPRWLELAVIRR